MLLYVNNLQVQAGWISVEDMGLQSSGYGWYIYYRQHRNGLGRKSIGLRTELLVCSLQDKKLCIFDASSSR